MPVPIGNSKQTVQTYFFPCGPKLKYLENNSNCCCFSSLDPVLFKPRAIVDAESISGFIEWLFVYQYNRYSDIVIFDDKIMMDQSQKKCDKSFLIYHQSINKKGVIKHY